MGESMSRYSIVERLTKQKLDIMSAKHSLTDDVKKAEQKHTSMKDIVDDECDRILASANVDVEELKRKTEGYEVTAKNLKERQSDKEKMYDEKIKVIDEALDKIEEISKIQGQ